ncbi:hypothetical protein CsSME_00024487 [Camellia sinensis var. sinensis]
MGIKDISPLTQTPQTKKTKDKGLALPTILEEQTRNNNHTPESIKHRFCFTGGSSHHFLLEKDYRDRIIDSMGMEIPELKVQLKRVMGDPIEKRTDQSQPIPVQSEAASSHTCGSHQRRAKRKKTASP